jgi:hypothetical protein
MLSWYRRWLFVENPITGDRSFYDKLKEQLGPGTPAVKKLASECLWLLLLFVSETTFSAPRKRERILEVWAQAGDSPNTVMARQAAFVVHAGIVVVEGTQTRRGGVE